MKRIVSIIVIILFLGLGAAPLYEAVAAENTRDLSGTLSRLKNNPRYQGRVLGTHIKRNNGGYLYEVRILRRDDRVILVYIDPETGGVVGDSERTNRAFARPTPEIQLPGIAPQRPSKKPKRKKRRN